MLEQNELTEILRRAQEIQATPLTVDPISGYQEYIDAAEEAGISREATLQALRERLGLPVSTPVSGQLVFAKSADGHFYPARIQSAEGHNFKLRFMNGSEATKPMTDLRELSFTPGLKLNYSSPSSGGWWTGDFVRYNQDAQTVTVTCWGHEETVPLDQIRLKATNPSTVSAQLWIIRASQWLLAGGVGFALAWFLK
ncbi:MAG: hypothetical protein ABL949_03235 [Fimbriimonadaceae bacterium]